MALELTFRKTLRGLEPACEESTEAMKLWKIGALIKGEFRVGRSNKRLDWWWGLCTLIAENSETWPTKEAASDTLKMGIGIFESYLVKSASGAWIEKRKPGSIAFGNKAMTEDKFRAFCLRAQNYVCTDMLLCEGDDLARALEEYLNPDARRAA